MHYSVTDRVLCMIHDSTIQQKLRVVDVFNAIDTDGSGEIDASELLALCRNAHIPVRPSGVVCARWCWVRCWRV